MFAPRLVPTAELPPFKCVFTGLLDGPFIDAGIPIEALAFQNPRAYLHPTAVHQFGAAIGMVSKEEHEKTLEALALAEHQRDLMEHELAEAHSQLDAIDGLVANRDMVVRKLAGRKPRPKTDNKEKVA